MLYILPVIILVLFFFSNNKTLAIEFVLGVFLSECCCISFFFPFFLICNLITILDWRYSYLQGIKYCKLYGS